MRPDTRAIPRASFFAEAAGGAIRAQPHLDLSEQITDLERRT